MSFFFKKREAQRPRLPVSPPSIIPPVEVPTPAQIPVKELYSWIAKDETFLKRSTSLAKDIPSEQKIRIVPGQSIYAEKYEYEGGHTKLTNVTVNKNMLSDAEWFIYTDAWVATYKTAVDGETI